MEFLAHSAIHQISTGVAAGATTVNLPADTGVNLATAGCRGVTFSVLVGTVATGGTGAARIQGAVASAGPWVTLSNEANVSDVDWGDTDDNKHIEIGIRQSPFQYVRLQLERATANTTITAVVMTVDDAAVAPPASDSNQIGQLRLIG